MKQVFLFFVSLILAVPMVAQAAYTLPSGTSFTCDAASHYPVTHFYQMECRGVPLADSSGTVDGSFFLFSSGNISISVPVPAISGVNLYNSYVTSKPPSPLPGYFQFTWRAEDGSGVYHSGSTAVSWYNKLVCGGKACWYHPVLTEFTVTVDN